MNAIRKIKPATQLRSTQFRMCACGYSFNAAITSCPRCSAPIAPPPKAQRAKPKHPEDAHQTALFQWADRALGKYPELEMLFHVPNGGARDAREGGRLKAQGVRPGVPDVFLDVPRGTFHGLRIELKATRAELGRKPETSDAQDWWVGKLSGYGYRAEVCEGWEAARLAIESYLSIEIIPGARG